MSDNFRISECQWMIEDEELGLPIAISPGEGEWFVVDMSYFGMMFPPSDCAHEDMHGHLGTGEN